MCNLVFLCVEVASPDGYNSYCKQGRIITTTLTVSLKSRLDKIIAKPDATKAFLLGGGSSSRYLTGKGPGVLYHKEVAFGLG